MYTTNTDEHVVNEEKEEREGGGGGREVDRNRVKERMEQERKRSEGA